MKYTKISIITIVINDNTNISETIDSVITQNYKNLEYIIIDGDSSDGTQEIIKNYGNKITKFISEPDKGIADAFNKGTMIASGNIIGFLNSGDTYNSNVLDFVNKYYIKNNFNVLCGSINNYEGDDCINTQFSKPDKLKYRMSINHPATFIRTEIIKLVNGFDTNLKYAMDYDLLLKIYTTGINFHTVKDILVNMQLGGMSSCLNTIKEVKIIKEKHLGGFKYKYVVYYWLTYFIYIASIGLKRITPRVHYYLKRRYWKHPLDL